MTDNFRQQASLTGLDVNSYSLHGVASPVDYALPASNHTDGIEADDGAIHCICGFNEDDGNTVACDTCDRWQHIVCYYPQHTDGLPEDLDHWCVECRPGRPVNRQAAYIRQKEARVQRLAVQNGVKRQPKQSHKKKVKEPPSAGLANGWPLDKTRHDRNSASPRDLQPPSKKPKTSHRSSNSAVNPLSNGPSRKRNGSTITHQRSVSRSPDAYIPLYTEEFMQAYRQDAFTVPETNVCSITIYGAMAKWLSDPEEVIKITNGTPTDGIYQRWDGDINVLSGQTELDINEAHDPSFKSADGQFAFWKYATASEPIAAQTCIGELRGHVGFKEEYQQEPSNRWATVRHPEPFVFFHPKLPICIDTREEGTSVRYIRRSCLPNAELKIIITGSNKYHFCFIALRDIGPGEEICVMWDMAPLITARDTQSIPPTEMNMLRAYCSTVLANCGPCGCNRADCKMLRFDKRGSDIELGSERAKPPKMAAKKRKAASHISPLNTHTVNSRSGSEARRVDHDDEPTDSRSVSGSVGRGSASRDITPNTHSSTNGTSEMSERERKKLAKVEELFHKQEEEQTGRQPKKKRSSAGSTLNTPGLTSSKQLGIPNGGSSKYADAGTSRQSGLVSSKTTSGRRPKSTIMNRNLTTKPTTKTVKAPKPVYVDSSVQCDMDEEEAASRPPPPRVPRPFIPLQQRLLERCARNNALWKKQQLALRFRKSTDSAMDLDERHDQAQSSSDASQHEETDLHPSPARIDQDVNMQDIAAEAAEQRATSADLQGAESLKQEKEESSESISPPAPHLSANPPAPPWPAEPPAASADDTALPKPSPPEPVKAQELHIPMPPPTANPFAAAAQPPLGAGSAANNITGRTAIQSPAALAPTSAAPPLFSPAVTAAVNPSPARKKLSLSDYTRRSKAKDRDSEAKPDRESSPASVASGPASGAVLQTSSSDMARVKESGSAIEEDMRMEDATTAP